MKPAINDQRLHILGAAKPLIVTRGFTAVGLTELLAAARVPKGSFYHYFASKEEFGVALLDWYFEDQLANLDELLTRPLPAAGRLMLYWQYWLDAQGSEDPENKCLAVKLSAEVSDLSEPMRQVLERGIGMLIARLSACVEDGQADGSVPARVPPRELATELYQQWMGASILAKVMRRRAPLDMAMAATVQALKQ
jgi:TetR/AcrR family transcriptional repressor of nem operon